MHASGVLQSTVRPQGVSSSSSEPTSTSATGDQNVGVRKARVVCDNMAVARPVVNKSLPTATKFACLCAPTTHAGSFRCRFHRGATIQANIRAPLVPNSNGVPASFEDATSRLAMPPCPSGNSLKGPSHAAEKTLRRMLSVPRSASTHKTIRSFQARPSRLSRMIVAVPPDAGATATEDSNIAEDPQRFTELGNGAQGAAIDASLRRS